MESKNTEKDGVDKTFCSANTQNKSMKKTSRLAIASLVSATFSVIFGFVSFFSPSPLFYFLTFRAYGIFAVSALILGFTAIMTIAFRRKVLKGYEYAIIATSIAFLCILCSGIITRFMDYRGKYNLRKINESMTKYITTHNGYLPNANQWCDLLIEYDKALSKANFKHPKVKEGNCNFAFNKNLSGLRLSDIPEDIVLLFEADGSWNLHGGVELLKERGSLDTYVLLIDGDMHRYSFTDGGIKKWDPNSKETVIVPLRWKP